VSKDLGTYELIQDYLGGKLNGEVLAEFERRMTSEKDFKQYVQNHKAANVFIRKKELNAIKRELQIIHDKSKYSGRNWKPFLGLFFGLLLSILMWDFSSSSDSNPNESIVKVESISVVSDGPKREITPVKKEEQMLTSIEENDTQVLPRNIKSKRATNSKIENLKNDSLGIYEIDLKPKPLESIGIKQMPPDSLGIKQMSNKLNPMKGKTSTLNNDIKSEKVNCNPYSVTLDLNVHPTCRNKSEGMMKILNEEFTKGYRFQMDKFEPQDGLTFSKLSAGFHDVYVIDERGCKSVPYEAEIPEVNCVIIIHPAQNIFWEIPQEMTSGKDAELEIFNVKTGALVYSQKLNSNDQNFWHGRGWQGQTLPMGAYIFICTSNGHKSRGDITIVQ